MSTIEEVLALEERPCQAELGPDAAFFAEMLADDAIIDGQQMKAAIVEAHRTTAQKFTDVQMRDMQVIDHGDVAVVTCVGHFVGPQFTGDLRFMRVWQRRDGHWRVIAASTASAPV